MGSHDCRGQIRRSRHLCRAASSRHDTEGWLSSSPDILTPNIHLSYGALVCAPPVEMAF
jgi:hypothetical protein